MPSIRHILVATDFSESSQRARELALEFARKFGAQITLIHVNVPPPTYGGEGMYWPTDELTRQAAAALDGALAALKKEYPESESVLGYGVPWEQIVTAAKERNADLIVVGTHGRRGVPRALLGSVAEKVVRMSPVPVLTVHGDTKG